MEKEEDMFEVYNVGSNTTYSVIDVVRILKSLVNHDAPVEFISGMPSMIPVSKLGYIITLMLMTGV